MRRIYWTGSLLCESLRFAAPTCDASTYIFCSLLAGAGGGLNFVKPKYRPFSLLDLTISYPYVEESISTTTLALVALLAPAAIIAIICIIVVPGPSFRRSLTRSQTLRRKFWELHVGLAGLALSVALGFFVTQGVKNIFPKPRPHFIAVCKPDLNNIASYVVGGEGQDISIRWTLVSPDICMTPNTSLLDDSFRSFPSGHCSFSWSGLLYLTYFLCAKFSITIPYLPTQLRRYSQINSAEQSADIEMLPMPATSSSATSKAPLRPRPNAQTESSTQLYNQAATPPNYGLLLALIPLGVATYIASTRYSEYWHFAFDCLSGSLIGILSASLAFRWYHLPIRRGHGWAWGPRSRDRAFGVGVGVEGYVGPEGWESEERRESGLQTH